MKKLVREHINEVFTDNESDPISDMGIGGYTYETLSPGAILVPKRLGFAVTKNQSGRFTSWHSGMQLPPNSFLLITSINRFNQNYKDIYFKKYLWYNDWLEHEKETILEDIRKYPRNKIKMGEKVRSGTPGRMIVSKKKFDYRFEIIEKGF